MRKRSTFQRPTAASSAALTLQLALLLGGAAAAQAPRTTAPAVPEAIKAPSGQSLVLVAHAAGAQIYLCTTAADGTLQWKLKAPDAELRDEAGSVIGHHSAGPSWKHRDGSEVAGRMVSAVDAPDADSIPWLLLTAVSHAGDGVLAHVASIQRIHTRGGQPPPAAQCDAARHDAQVRVPYRADYYFFAPT